MSMNKTCSERQFLQTDFFFFFFFFFHVNFWLHCNILKSRRENEQREHKVGELELFQPFHQLLEVVLRKISRVFFKDGFRGLARRRVKQHELGHTLSERLRDVEKLLGQHAYADVGMASGKA